MNSHQRRKFAKVLMSELMEASQSEIEKALIDAAEDHIKQEKRIEQLERQLAERDAEIAKLIETTADHVTVRAEQYAELQKYRDAPVVAYRHMMDDGWEYFDAPTGEDCSGCVSLIVKPGEQ